MRAQLSDQPAAVWWAAASGGLMIVGAFGPWARALFVTVYGIDGDGWFLIGGGVVALGVLYLYARRGRATSKILPPSSVHSRFGSELRASDRLGWGSPGPRGALPCHFAESSSRSSWARR